VVFQRCEKPELEEEDCRFDGDDKVVRLVDQALTTKMNECLVFTLIRHKDW